MIRPLPSPIARRLAVVVATSTLACGGPKPDEVGAERQAQAREQPAAGEPAAGPRRPSWQRDAIALPATFAGFARPDLAKLDGIWVVEPGDPRQAEVWIVAGRGSQVTTVDRAGREVTQGMILSSPCSVRLIDDTGDSEPRAVAQLDERLIVTREGVVALAGPDGALLACAGRRTFQISADGLCRFTTEGLGVWADPSEAEAACRLERVDGAVKLTIAGQPLREVAAGIWLDARAEADVALPAGDRRGALAQLRGELDAPSESGETGETAASETGETGERAG